MATHSWIGFVLLLAAPAGAAEPEVRRDAEGFPLPPGALARLGSLMLQHERPVRAAIFSHDGSEIISVGMDYQVRVWDAQTGKAKTTWPLGTQTEPGGLTLSRKGDLLLTAFTGGDIGVYEVASGKKRFTLSTPPGPNPPSILFPRTAGLAISADDKTVLTVSIDRLVVHQWDLATGKALKMHKLPGHPLRPVPVLLSPDAKGFAWESMERKELVFFDAESGKETKKLALQENPARFSPAVALVGSPDGKLLAAVKDRKLTVLDLEAGKLLATRLLYGSVSGAKFSPDGRWLVTWIVNSQQAIIGSYSGLELRRLDAPSLNHYSVAGFSPDGRRLVLVNQQSTRIRLWDFQEEQEQLSDETTNIHAAELDWLSDGRLVARKDGLVKVLEVPSGRVVGRQDVGASRLVVSADGKGLVWANPAGRVGSWVPGQPAKEIEVPAGVDRSGRPPVVSPDGKQYAYLAEHDNLRLRNLETGKEIELTTVRPFPQPSAYPRPLGFTRDSRYFLGITEGRPQLWDVSNGKLFPFHTADIHVHNARVDFTADGRLVSLAANNIVLVEFLVGWPRLWVNLQQLDGNVAPPWPPPAQPEVVPTCFSPDGLLLARPGSDGSVRVFCVTQSPPKLVGTLPGFQGKITALAFSRDGKALASAGNNGTVLVWEVASEWKQIKSLFELKPDQLGAPWEALVGNNGDAVYEQMRRLGANPKLTLPFLREKLKERAAPDAKQISHWIEEVVTSKRLAAVDDLIEAGPIAQEEVSKALAALDKDNNQRFVAENLRKALNPPDSLVGKRDLRRIRVIEILEWIGTAEARELLVPLSKGPKESVVTWHAREALARLGPASDNP
jgi:WD40 repeat protein